ncbi:hypothetical protein B0O99DRAFT_687433 [Bisporella sp. PMI_857]|nr:hypothetical protein B0O99DRAFT_687433 [Bisporella sp. PMI_857]
MGYSLGTGEHEKSRSRASSSLVSRPSSITNLGSLMEQSESPLLEGTTHSFERVSTASLGSFKSTSVILPPVAIGRPLSSSQVSKEGPRLRREMRRLPTFPSLQGLPLISVEILLQAEQVQVRRQRGKVCHDGRNNPEQTKKEVTSARVIDPGPSDAIRASRFRRAERAAKSMPFTDRVRHQERKRFWGGMRR